MSLDPILAHIINEADVQKDSLIHEASKQAQELIQAAKEEADKLYQEIIEREKSFALSEKQRLLVNARLEAKKNLLKVKQELIDAVCERLKSGLSKEKLKKKRIFLDNEEETPEDIDFYLDKIRLDYESEIARNLFG